jgi:single-strand DNA-binding protein
MELSLTYEEVSIHMKSVNKVILLGNLTRDPEMVQSEGKHAKCSFGLAINRSWVSYTGEKHEETEFHRLVAWDKLAEVCNQYLKKGRKVYVEGRLQTRSYKDKDGVEKSVTEIVLDEMVMLDKMPEDVKESLELEDQSNGAPVQV